MSIKSVLLVASSLSLPLMMATSLANAPVETQIASQSVILDIPNMTCAICQITIKKALQKVDGIKQVNVDYEAKAATVIFEPRKTNLANLIKALIDAGYPATIRPAAQ